jgi:Flp pilus assembly protein TadG
MKCFSLATRRRRRGAALLEFALVASLFFVLLLGMLQFGVYLNATNTLWNLSREGARFAAVQRSDSPTASQNNQKIIDHITKPSPEGMLPPTVDPQKLTITIEPSEAAARTRGSRVTVTLSYDMTDKLFVPIGNSLGKQYRTTTSMMVE